MEISLVLLHCRSHPSLDRFQLNGGTTRTHAPLPDSPVINIGNPFISYEPEVFDQRGDGYARVVGGRIDIGAYEVQPAVGLIGDFDRNGVVEQDDYDIWADSFGNLSAPFDGADGNGDGRIDIADYTIWRDNYNPPDAVISKVTSQIVIDGSLDAIWSDTFPIPIDTQLFGMPVNNDDLSATWRLLWDDSSLYILAEVTDDFFYVDSPNNPYQDDGLELFFDVDYSQTNQYDNVNDTQLMLRLGDDIAHTGANSIPGGGDGVIYKTGFYGNSYIIEAAIPWNTIGGRPLVGNEFGIDVAVSDDDDGGGINFNGVDGRLGWPDSQTMAFADPSIFGTAVLSDQLVSVAQPILTSQASRMNDTIEEAYAMLLDESIKENIPSKATYISVRSGYEESDAEDTKLLLLASIRYG